MRKILLSIVVLAAAVAVSAKTVTVTVSKLKYQKVTGFGAACSDGAMCPYGSDTAPVRLLYGPQSKVGFNIMRMEISPNFIGDIIVAEWNNWDSPYDWKGSLPSAKIVKQRGGIVFGTPWSPPGEYKTNGGANGGNTEDENAVKGKLREDCYDKFFPWLNTFLDYMKKNGVDVDAVSIQNEPDWWVNYSGCLYDPQDLVKLVKNYAHQLDREKYNGVKLISGESLGFTQNYTDPLMNDATCRKQIDIVAGHLYGHAPLDYMKKSAVLAAKYGKEVWMTEHSVSFSDDRLPTWHEQLRFAEEVNECMLSGCTGYIYWYMRAHWAFVSTGEEQYGPENKIKNRLLPRAYVMSHFSKHLPGSTRLNTVCTEKTKTEAAFETSAYIKGDSLIVMAIDTTEEGSDFRIRLPYMVKSGVQIQSTSHESLCQETDIEIAEPTKEIIIPLPGRSLTTFIFTIDETETPVEGVMAEPKRVTIEYYDLQGRRLENPQGLYIEKRSDGTVRKVYKER